MEYYVYILKDPRKNNEPFYVGKGKDNRSEHHVKKYDTHNKLKTNVINKILKENLEVVIDYYRINLQEEEAHKLEIELISKIGRRDLGTGPLTNLTNGGEGVSGYVRSIESKAQVSQKRKETGVHDKISEKLKGRKLSEEHRKNLSKSHKGKTQSEESKQKRSNTLTNKPKTEEHKQNIRKSKLGSKNPMFGKTSPNKGKIMSEEQKEKIRLSELKKIAEKKSK